MRILGDLSAAGHGLGESACRGHETLPRDPSEGGYDFAPRGEEPKSSAAIARGRIRTGSYERVDLWSRLSEPLPISCAQQSYRGNPRG